MDMLSESLDMVLKMELNIGYVLIVGMKLGEIMELSKFLEEIMNVESRILVLLDFQSDFKYIFLFINFVIHLINLLLFR